MPDNLIQPYCTIAWADAFFASYIFDGTWSDSSVEKKQSALNAASDFINLYCQFYDEDGNPVSYNPPLDDDFDDVKTPRRLKQAAAQEAAYLLSLDDNPAEPHPLTILGLIRGDFGTIDPELVPPIFPRQVVRLLTTLGGEISPDARSTTEFGCQTKRSTL